MQEEEIMKTPSPFVQPSLSAEEAGDPKFPYKLRNPFDQWKKSQMESEAKAFARVNGLKEYETLFVRGGMLNLNVRAFMEEDEALEVEEREALNREYYPSSGWNRFRQPSRLYALVVLCSLAAAVQGWDESAVNGAQIYYSSPLEIGPQSFKYGLVNSAPYLCCIFSCSLLTYPLNKYFGRRGAIFLSCLVSFAACLGQAFVQSWQTLFVTRFLLGLGIGPKSATVPIYSAECAPANVRGALVMMWQMWTAFGIMLGYAAGAVLHNVNGSGQDFHAVDNPFHFRHFCKGSDEPRVLRSLSCSWNWRLMLASPMILPIIVLVYVFVLPESPRWLLSRAHKDSKQRKRLYGQAFDALVKLRPTKLQAARDLFLLDHELKAFEKIQQLKDHGVIVEFLSESKKFIVEGRSRRALLASTTCMFFQQFCGVNIMAYYSTSILLQAGSPPTQALLASLGFGIINWVFAFPAFWTIDTFGRRSLLLSTFPFMALFHLMIAIAFGISSPFNNKSARAAVIAGMYLFGIAYSPGEGPVPFVYSAESMPLYNRDIGMGIVTAILWGFNFFVAITWPIFTRTFKEWGAFAWYAAWCLIGEVTILLIVPETKAFTLEELTEIFNRPLSEHCELGLRQAKAFLMWCTGRKVKWPVLIEKQRQDIEMVVLEDEVV